MATKKRRAPRQVWITIREEDGEPMCVERTRKEAGKWSVDGDGTRCVGPYVLAERVRER